MVSKGRHPKKEIAAALASLDRSRFEVNEVHRGHRWGLVRCLACKETIAVYCTPRVPANDAKMIIRFAASHEH